MAGICKKCLIREMAEADYAMIEKYRDAILPADRADGVLYEKRLGLCKECEKLNAGTCLACGCYVELRAAAKAAHCPHNLW